MRRFLGVLLACVLALGCAAFPVSAAELPDDSFVIARVSGQLNHRLPANGITPITQPVSLGKNESVTYNCTYLPKSASLDFGYIDSDYAFQYLNCTSGSIYKALEATKSGQYTIAIRNNEDYAVTVKGTIKY